MLDAKRQIEGVVGNIKVAGVYAGGKNPSPEKFYEMLKQAQNLLQEITETIALRRSTIKKEL
ncbi:hypothetical protein KC865_04760 [Candidatus Kaiserbacteria bacterium]|nr:hypothetical protein [Candidatus Kaiserbacteria bacterium]USN92091.1 MAG: hypothetical protein H6782_04420 [Candidatus Nomurabacteria bacterium]